jgi:hypothetical protein
MFRLGSPEEQSLLPRGGNCAMGFRRSFIPGRNPFAVCGDDGWDEWDLWEWVVDRLSGVAAPISMPD